MSDAITPEQSAVVARTLFLPTIQRMSILCSSLISTTANGDFALWAPLTVMEKMLADLKWSEALAPERFLALIALTLDLPYFGQAKASYALGLVGPLAVAFALGVDACDRALAALGGAGAARAGRAFWVTTGAVLWLSMAA